MFRLASLLRSLCLAALSFVAFADGAAQTTQQPGNKPERLEWFRDQGLGLFIHWSADSQLGFVISHSLAGASDAYVDRYYRDLLKTFDPTHLDPRVWLGWHRLRAFATWCLRPSTIAALPCGIRRRCPSTACRRPTTRM